MWSLGDQCYMYAMNIMYTTIITLMVLVSVGIVTVDGECQPNNGPIENCCCLGYNNNNYNVKSSGVYTIGNFC